MQQAFLETIPMTTSSYYSQQLKALCARYWEHLCFQQPLIAIMAGRPDQSGVLLRSAPADFERASAADRAFLCDLHAIPFAELRGQDRQAYRLLEHDLKLGLRAFEARDHLRPVIYPFGVESQVNYLGDITAFTCAEDAELYIRRLKSIPGAFKGTMECLAAGQQEGFHYPRIIIERASATLRALLARPPEQATLMRPFLKSPGLSEEMKVLRDSAVAVMSEIVNPALAEYADFIEKDLGATSRESLGCTDVPQGDEHYRMLIERYTTEHESPDEIHAFGLSEVERICGEMQQIATEAGFCGDLGAYRTALLAKPGQILPGAEALRERIEVLSKRIDARLPEFFGRLPRMSYGVQSIPEAVAVHMPPAYAQPNPANGTAAGVHWITSLPDRCPSYIHIPLALHEAFPGHLMHMALMQEMDLPEFRRFNATRFSAQLEGWALYCEWLGYEFGLYDDPDKRYGRLEMEMWRACRLVVDTGLHAKGWSREKAIGFMADNMSMSNDSIEAEVDRYIGWPAQALGYLIGFRCVKALRVDAERLLGPAFRVRDFHDALMEVGAVTLPVWKEWIHEWIEARKPAISTMA